MAAVVAADRVAAVTELTRADELRAFGEVVAGCTKCALAGGRTQVVFGSGDPNADLMFVGEAPGFHEDKQGVPFVGAAGKLLDQLLAGIGLTRPDVFVANVLKCRPPGNRDPMPDEIEACEGHLWRQSPRSSSAGSDRVALARGDGGDRGSTRPGPGPRRRGDRLGRARIRQDDLRARGVPRPRRRGSRDEPDVHDRPPLSGPSRSL